MEIYALLAVFCSVCSIRSYLEQCCMILESLIALGVEIASKVIVYTVFSTTVLYNNSHR